MLLDIGGGILIDPVEQIRQLDQADCEDDLYTFLKMAWPHFDSSKWIDSWCLGAIAEHLQAVCDGEIRRLIVNIPPRHGKTNLLSAAFPAWVWAQQRISHTSGPGVRFLCTSYALKLSRDGSDRCRRIIKSDWYQKLFGDRFQLRKDKDGIDEFGNDKGGERIIRSVGSGTTGVGGDIIIADDPNDASDEKSEITRESVINWWDGTMSTRLNDQNLGALILLQQRIAEDDLTGHLLEKHGGEWDHLMLPARYEPERSFATSIGWIDPRTEPGELLWPERFNDSAMASLERGLGKFKAAGQLQQRPDPAGGGIIKREWWKLWEQPSYPPMDYILASLDTAYTVKTENDFSALTVWGVFTQDGTAIAIRYVGEDGKAQYIDRSYNGTAPSIMLMTAWQERLEFHDLVQRVADTCKRFRVDKLIIENKAAGISVSQELRRLYGGEDFSVQLHDPKSADKVSRLYSVQHLFSEGMVYAPDKQFAEMVITQVGQFPKGKHDDLVDTVSQSLRHLRDIGLITRSAERLDMIEQAKKWTGHQADAPLYPV